MIAALKIHISGSTKSLLDTFKLFEMEYRGEIDMKGKGRQKTYFLIREISAAKSANINDNPVEPCNGSPIISLQKPDQRHIPSLWCKNCIHASHSALLAPHEAAAKVEVNSSQTDGFCADLNNFFILKTASLKVQKTNHRKCQEVAADCYFATHEGSL